jgi:NADP-dependent 3-hydroxy acid dehydrogenase YdfG
MSTLINEKDISIGKDALAIQLEVTNQHSTDAAAERFRSELDRLDVLINNG